MGGVAPDTDQTRHDSAVARLNRLAAAAWLALWVERLWPRLWPPAGTVLLFLSLSWFGLWQALPELPRLIALLLFGCGFVYSLKGFLTLSRPTVDDALRRIDRDSSLAHGEAETLNDRLAIGREDPAARELWLLHRRRAVAAIPGMRVSLPNPDMPRHDRYAIRSALILMAVASAFIAGPHKAERLEAAFRPPRWFDGSDASAPALTGWINPPAYTRLPPQMLDLAGGDRTFTAPVGSTLILRARKGAQIATTFEPPLAEVPEPPAAGENAQQAQLEQHRYTLDRKTSLSIRSGWFGETTLTFDIIPDRPPDIAFAGEITRNLRGSFVLSYKTQDDYGVIDAKAVFTIDPAYRPLVAAPEVALQPPSANDADQPQRQTVDLTDHPWAGAPVKMTLVARDASGQEGRSETIDLILPERPFTVPLAKALAEQRRVLILAEQRSIVLTALEGLLTAPEVFTPQAGVFLGLRRAARMVRTIRSKEDQLTAAEWLWAMAVQIEDGSLSDAERDLRAAQDRLQDAIARGADQREIDRLAGELRQAMNRYLQELAARAAQNKDGSETVTIPSGQTITQDELSRLIDRFEELMRQGRTAEAQQLLEQLRGIFDNLQMANPGSQAPDPMAREMMQSMAEANRLLQDQQKLRDETYERNRQELYQDDNPSGSESRLKPLQPQQQDLARRLEELKRQGRRLGLEPDENFDEAERAMREAEEALGDEDGSGAVDAQARAIEALKNGAQQMIQQAQRMFGSGSPVAGGTGSGNPFPSDSLLKTKDGRERIRELIEQLRNKLSDPTRPKDELDYFERLLRQN